MQQQVEEVVDRAVLAGGDRDRPLRRLAQLVRRALPQRHLLQRHQVRPLPGHDPGHRIHALGRGGRAHLVPHPGRHPGQLGHVPHAEQRCQVGAQVEVVAEDLDGAGAAPSHMGVGRGRSHQGHGQERQEQDQQHGPTATGWTTGHDGTPTAVCLGSLRA
jgi:hypothetical protein